MGAIAEVLPTPPVYVLNCLGTCILSPERSSGKNWGKRGEVDIFLLIQIYYWPSKF